MAETQDEITKNGVRRFYIPMSARGQPHKIVFLDGELNDHGMLDTPMFWEYTVHHAGKWQNFVKPDDSEGPDPIAADGNTAVLVQVFTILNLTPFIRKDGTAVEAHKQLFVCKRSTMKRLTQMAKKRGSLTGCMFDVSCSNDKAEKVGDTFDFDRKVGIVDLVQQFGAELVTPMQYDTVVEYRGVDELKRLGFGLSCLGKSRV